MLIPSPDTVSQVPRSRTPGETLDVIKPWLKKAGVTRLADLTGMDCLGIHVFASIRPDSKSLTVDSGKGVTKEHAKCSAAMESLERWALDEVKVPCLAQGRAKETRFPRIRGSALNNPKWAEAIDLATGEIASVPYYCVKMYTGEETLQDRVFAASTNGMASGNTREEAIASGLFEVIERDAMNIALTNEKAKRCRIDTSHDPFTLSAIESARKADCEFFCYDCTSDTGVPVFLCILADKQRGVGLYKGYGCHLCPDIALNRAICEAAQARCVIMAGARDDITWAVHRNVIANTVDIDWVYEFNKQDFSTDLADMSDLSTGSAEHDIQKALAMLDSAGFDRALVVDFPIEDAPFSCVKVLVPGMAGYKFLNGVNPGRVLEVGRNNKQIENQ